MQNAPFVFLHEVIYNTSREMDNSSIDHLQRGGVLSGDSPFSTLLSKFLVQAVIAIALSRFFHIFLRKLRQPRVIAEILAGLCLGPSVLGRLPGFRTILFPETSRTILNLSADVALILYLFLVGLEIEPKAFWQSWNRSGWISLTGVACPCLLGMACSYGLYTYVLQENDHIVPIKSFVLFVGVSMSITALPVLARILIQRKLITTPVGTVAISVAAIDSALSWSLLAFIIAISKATDNLVALYVCLLISSYSFILITIVRSLFGRLFDRFLVSDAVEISQFWTALIFICLFLSAWLTEMMGVHAVFGAFSVGLIIPRKNNFSIRLAEKIEDVILIVFLPLFFVSSGLKTNMDLLNDGTTWLWLFIVIFTAIFGKLIGCLIAARLVGMGWRESFSVGILMNTKGLIGLIAFNIGHDIKVINDRIFLIMVITTLTTTFITSPILSAVYSPKYWKSPAKQRPSGRLSLTRKRMSVFHKISQTFSNSSQRGSLPNVDGQDSIAKISLLLYLGDDFGPLISMVRLMLLFQVDQFALNVNATDSLSISILKIVEPTERTSSIMITKKIDEVVKTDISLNMMRMFATIVNVPVNSLASASPASEIGDEVNQVAESESSDLVLVPYGGQKAVGGLTSRNPLEKIRDVVRTVRRAAVCVVASKSNFVSGMDTGSVCSILAVVGGTIEDVLVLKLALRFVYCKSFTVHITVLKFEEHGADPSTFTEKLIARLTTEYSANVTMKVLHSVQTDCIVLSESSRKEYDFVLLPRSLQGYTHSCQQSRSSLKSMSNLSRVGTDIAPSSKTFVRNLINRKLNEDQSISRNQSETTSDGMPTRLSPTMEQRRAHNADDSDSLASTKSSKKKRIEIEILGHVGLSLFNSSDLNAVLLVISQNV